MITAAVGALALADSAFAQAAQGDQDSTQLEEVIVTARRAEENLQSVPVTVSAFSSQAIRETGIRSSNDLMNVTPGIYTLGSGSPSNTLYSIRGQSKPIAGNSPAGVVSYFAEVPLPTQASAPSQYDLSNIQVLKGPQGTLFGKNTLGGAILVYPNTPTYDFGGYLQGTAGNYNWYELEGAVNLPLVQDKAALRIAGRYATRDGYVKNLGGDHDNVADLGAKGVRASLLLDPTDWLKNTLIVDYDHDKTNGPGQILTGLNPSSPLFPVFGQFLTAQYAAQLARGPRVTDTGSINPREDIKRWGVTNRTEVSTGVSDIKLINIFGYRNVNYFTLTNIDGLPDLPIAPGVGLHFLDAERQFSLEQYSEELQVRGSAFDSKLQWLLGGFYLKEQPDGPVYDDLTILGQPSDVYSFLTTTSKAVFGNLSYDLSDLVQGLKFNLGYRYTWDQASLCSAGAAITPLNKTIEKGDCLPSNPALAGAATIKSNSSAPTWTIGLDYQVNKDVFLYVTSRRGYRAGGLNSPKLGPAFTAFQSFAPETVTDVEAGVRSDWHVGDVTGRLNLSIFTEKNKRVQVPIPGLTTSQSAGFCQGTPPAPVFLDGDCNPLNDPANGTLIFNTGQTKVNGIEFDTAVKPIRDLTFTFNGSFMQQKVLKVGVPPVGAAITNPQNVFFQFTPKVSYTIGMRYRLPVPDQLGEVAFNVLFSHIGDINAVAYVLPAHDTTNLRLDWNDVNGMPIDIGLFARNVGNKTDIVGSAINVAALPWSSAQYNEPRLYGVELRYRFGGK
jgi:iron complex outermembrane receptor protein